MFFICHWSPRSASILKGAFCPLSLSKNGNDCVRVFPEDMMSVWFSTALYMCLLVWVLSIACDGLLLLISVSVTQEWDLFFRRLTHPGCFDHHLNNRHNLLVEGKRLFFLTLTLYVWVCSFSRSLVTSLRSFKQPPNTHLVTIFSLMYVSFWSKDVFHDTDLKVCISQGNLILAIFLFFLILFI